MCWGTDYLMVNSILRHTNLSDSSLVVSLLPLLVPLLFAANLKLQFLQDTSQMIGNLNK